MSWCLGFYKAFIALLHFYHLKAVVSLQFKLNLALFFFLLYMYIAYNQPLDLQNNNVHPME